MISIIVTSYDMGRLQDIKDLLASIQEQSAKNFEVVYVTERSRDLYESVKGIFADKGIPGTVIHNEGRWGLAEARNLGASYANGDILAFVDDDVVLSKDWAVAVEKAFCSLNNIVGATGPAYPLWVGEPARWLPEGLDWLIGCTRWFKADRPVAVRNCWGMNMAFRRNVFFGENGFSEETGFYKGYIAEDVDLSLRIRRTSGRRLFYIPQMVVFSKVHSYRLSNRFVIKRSEWIGYTRPHIEKIVSDAAAPSDHLEVKLIRGLLKTLIVPDTKACKDWKDISKRFRVSMLSLFSLALGYLFGYFT